MRLWRGNWIVVVVLAVTAVMGSRPVRADEKIAFEKDIEFANPDEQHLQLDMARPDGEGPYPAVVFIHGGGFRTGNAAGLRRTYQEVGARTDMWR